MKLHSGHIYLRLGGHTVRCVLDNPDCQRIMVNNVSSYPILKKASAWKKNYIVILILGIVCFSDVQYKMDFLDT